MTGFALSLTLVCAVALAAYLVASAYYKRPAAVATHPGAMPQWFADGNGKSIRFSIKVGGQWDTGIYDRRVVASAGA